MFQEGTNGLYLFVKFEALTTYRDGDINQTREKSSIFTLGKESCMKFRKLYPTLLYQLTNNIHE